MYFSIGKLHVVVGPMASEKSTYTMNALTKHAIVTGERVLFIDSDKNTRPNKYSTHCRSKSITDVELIDFKSLPTLYEMDFNDLNDYKVIGIDEGQFFEDLYEFVKYCVQNLGKTLYVSGLDGTSEMKSFGQMCNLVPIADTFVKLQAICKQCYLETGCYIEAPFTKYVGGELKSADEKVGGLDIYQPTCRLHYRSYDD